MKADRNKSTRQAGETDKHFMFCPNYIIGGMYSGGDKPKFEADVYMFDPKADCICKKNTKQFGGSLREEIIDLLLSWNYQNSMTPKSVTDNIFSLLKQKLEGVVGELETLGEKDHEVLISKVEVFQKIK